uniref:MANSC domain-containing protein n=1 Tax=Anopheles farauti TaxID=69004 RepID=A0A182QVA5_9DIPT
MERGRRRFNLITSTGKGTIATAFMSLVILITIIPYHATIALPDGTFPVAKRMNIETCLVRFDVHLNTIIRTEESRSMGARFLDDADLNSREQCLRLCCETENCDVFVFEEKSPGTCFLFQCGPPENFRCKFTRHSNYTSAVLSIPPPPMEQPPPPPPLAAQIQSLAAQTPTNGGSKPLSQHEMELVSLKDVGNSKIMAANFATASSTTPLPPLGVRLGEILTTPIPSTPKQQFPVAQQCGHFEFPCHSGECIAVYNVCDGIVQCDDGSDEGAECPQKNPAPIIPSTVIQGKDPGSGLDTPDSHIFNHKGGLQLPAVNNVIPSSQQYQDTLSESSYLPSSSVMRGGGGKSYLAIPNTNGYSPQAAQQYPPEQPQQLPSYKSVLSSQWMGSNNMRSSWPSQPGEIVPNNSGAGVGAPPQEQYIQPPVQQRHPSISVQDIQSTSNGADVPSSSSSVSLQQPALNQPHLPGTQWASSPMGTQTGLGLVTPTPVSPATADGTATRTGSDGPSKDSTAGHESLPTSGSATQNGVKHKSSPSDASDAGVEYEEDAYEDTYPESTNAAGTADVEDPSQTATQTEPPKKKLRKHHKHDHEHGGGAGKQASSDTANSNAANDQPEQKKKKKTKIIKKDKAATQGDHGAAHHAGSSDPIVHEHLKALHKDLEIEFADHDGYADRPGGAMLSLTLGVLLTAAMGILLSCRMRVARRRIRRPGKSSYAHDADFLVNGMYL